MSDSLLTFLQHLREFGLVFQRKVTAGDTGGGWGTWGGDRSPSGLILFPPLVSVAPRPCHPLVVVTPIVPTVSPQRKSRRFYPTRLAIALASGTSGCPPEPDARGFVIVETNYRIYAYTGLSPNAPKCPQGGDTGPRCHPIPSLIARHILSLCVLVLHPHLC